SSAVPFSSTGRWTTGLVVSLLVLLSGCGGDKPPSPPTPTRPPLQGVVYLSAGVDESTASLYHLTTRPFDFHVVFQAPPSRGIDWVAGLDGVVLVSQQGQADRVTPAGLASLPGLPPRAVVPEPLPDGKLAFITHFTPHLPDGTRLATRFQLN